MSVRAFNIVWDKIQMCLEKIINFKIHQVKFYYWCAKKCKNLNKNLITCNFNYKAYLLAKFSIRDDDYNKIEVACPLTAIEEVQICLFKLSFTKLVYSFTKEGEIEKYY